MVRFKFKNSLGCAPWPCLSQHNVAQLLVVSHFRKVNTFKKALEWYK